jgi:hypothetical protein
MPSNWENLLAQALKQPMRPEDLEEQRRSFAYGNTHLENSHITREMIDEEAERQVRERESRGR